MPSFCGSSDQLISLNTFVCFFIYLRQECRECGNGCLFDCYNLKQFKLILMKFLGDVDNLPRNDDYILVMIQVSEDL